MNAPPQNGPGENRVLEQLQEPALWRLFDRFPPVAVRRMLHAVCQELSELAFPADVKARRDARIVENARRLGVRVLPQTERRFLRRHHRLVTLRQAEELLCLFGDVDAQVRWAEEAFVVRGLDHAGRAVKAGRGAIVVSAHLGAFLYYIPMLVYFLSKAGPVPEMLAVMNEPTGRHAEAIRSQLARFAGHHASRFGLLAKAPERELELWRKLDDALARRAWVMMQVDVVTGGSNLRPFDFAGDRIVLPGVWGAVRLARRRNVPILPVLTWRTRRDGLGLRVEPAVTLPSSSGAARSADCAETGVAAQRLATILEAWVCRDVADWGQLENAHLLFASRS